jgi:hypothetical protein
VFLLELILVAGFFPYPANGSSTEHSFKYDPQLIFLGAWDKVFADTFSPDLKATFNDTHYNYEGWLKLYHNFNVTLGQSFGDAFKHGAINTLGVPDMNGDKGGFAYMIGWEGGFHTLLKRDLYFTDATFAVVKEIGGKRKIVEFRESSNIPNTAPMPPANEWTCSFADNTSIIT